MSGKVATKIVSVPSPVLAVIVRPSSLSVYTSATPPAVSSGCESVEKVSDFNESLPSVVLTVPCSDNVMLLAGSKPLSSILIGVAVVSATFGAPPSSTVMVTLPASLIAVPSLSSPLRESAKSISSPLGLSSGKLIFVCTLAFKSLPFWVALTLKLITSLPLAEPVIVLPSVKTKVIASPALVKLSAFKFSIVSSKVIESATSASEPATTAKDLLFVIVAP